MHDPFAHVPISSQPPPQPLDPYKVLGVRPGVSEETLKAAFKRRSVETHPDHAGGSQEVPAGGRSIRRAEASVAPGEVGHLEWVIWLRNSRSAQADHVDGSVRLNESHAGI